MEREENIGGFNQDVPGAFITNGQAVLCPQPIEHRKANAQQRDAKAL